MKLEVFFAIFIIVTIGLQMLSLVFTKSIYEILIYIMSEEQQAPPELLFVYESSLERYHSWTKAIYDGEYIQDFNVECMGKRLINLTPIGEQIYVGENWIDPRPVEWQNKWC